MDEDGIPIVGAGIDYEKVKPIDKKRLLAFINHYVTHTVGFLNKFSGVCEEKMSNIEAQLQRLEVTMNILEAKLQSIPGLDDIKVQPTETQSTAVNNQNTSANAQPATTAPQMSQGVPPPPPPGASVEEQQQPAVEEQPPEPDVPKVSQDPQYARFFKMVNMGVPVQAVKLKMEAEGFDSSLLDNPNAPAPTGGQAANKQESSDSDAEFTDSD